ECRSRSPVVPPCFAIANHCQNSVRPGGCSTFAHIDGFDGRTALEKLQHNRERLNCLRSLAAAGKFVVAKSLVAAKSLVVAKSLPATSFVVPCHHPPSRADCDHNGDKRNAATRRNAFEPMTVVPIMRRDMQPMSEDARKTPSTCSRFALASASLSRQNPANVCPF